MTVSVLFRFVQSQHTHEIFSDSGYFSFISLQQSLFYTNQSVQSSLSLRVRFMKFNNRILRRILIRDNRAESSIVALYKKLELQNAMEILDTVAGDISAAPSIVSLQYETFIVYLRLSCHLLYCMFRSKQSFLLISVFFLSFSEEKKSSAKPKRKFLAADLRNMHDILSKNMYKIRQRVRN